MKKSHKIFVSTIVFILVLVSFALIFNQKIDDMIIDHVSSSKVNSINKHEVSKGQSSNVSYDFKNVKEVGNGGIDSVKARGHNAIGIIEIPDVNLKLPIFKGLDNNEMSVGVGTMKPNEKMGKGNYALAGHHMKNPKILFSPLAKVKNGQKIYLSNLNKKFVYQITSKKVVDETDVSVINDQGNKKELTLVTCASGNPGETRRIIVRAKLV